MKRNAWKRLRTKLAILGCSGFLTVSSDLACVSFGANQAIASFDFCFLLNCNDGAIGGLIDFCAPTNFTSFVGNNMANQPGDQFLADCPDEI
jgi:hypothetical protein